MLPDSITLPTFSTKEPKVGDEVEVFTLNELRQLVHKRSQITDMIPIASVPLNPPVERVYNTEGISTVDMIPGTEGVVLDPEEKSVIAMWMNFDGGGRGGLNYEYYVRTVVETLQQGRTVQKLCSGWNLGTTSLPESLGLGLAEHRAFRIAALNSAVGAVPRPVWVIGKLRPSACDSLKIGDILLEINGQPISRMADVRILSQLESAELLVLRNRDEVRVTLQQSILPPSPEKLLCWAGAILHRTHDAVLEQLNPEFLKVGEREGIDDPSMAVYVNCCYGGSPAVTGLPNGYWILEIDGMKVKGMDDMLTVIDKLKAKEFGEYVRVKLIENRGITTITSVRLDPIFWPAWTLERNGADWMRTELE